MQFYVCKDSSMIIKLFILLCIYKNLDALYCFSCEKNIMFIPLKVNIIEITEAIR